MGFKGWAGDAKESFRTYPAKKQNPLWSVWIGWIWAYGFGFEGPNLNSLFG